MIIEMTEIGEKRWNAVIFRGDVDEWSKEQDILPAWVRLFWSPNVAAGPLEPSVINF